MKLNKKFVAFNVLATLLFAETAMARIQGVRTPVERDESSSDGKPGKGSTTKKSTVVKEPSTNIKAALKENCVIDPAAEKYFPLSLMSQLTRDGDNIQIEKRANNTVVVKMPQILNVCGTFTPEGKQGQESRNLTIMMTLIDSKGKSLTYGEFEKCLVDEKILVDGKINHDAIPSTKYGSSIYSLDYDFDKKKDIQKSITVNFGYPVSYTDKRTGYDTFIENGILENESAPDMKCMGVEKIAEEPVFINKGKADYLAEINKICESGTAQEIANARNRLGNADALKDIADKIKEEMDAGYLAKAKLEVEEIYKKMKKLEDKLGTGKDSMSEKDAKKAIGEYAELAKQLNKSFLSPAIYRLDTLMQKRSKIEDEDSKEVKEIDSEIKKLNTDIGFFSTKVRDGIPSVYYVMEKYATNEDAKVIEDVYQKCKASLLLPKEEIINYVKEIYRPFKQQEISDQIAKIITPAETVAEVEVIYQTLDNLHIACPNHTGDWYFSGNYPTPGGNKVVNKAFVNWKEGNNQRAY